MTRKISETNTINQSCLDDIAYNSHLANQERPLNCPCAQGLCPHKHIGCEIMCNCINEVNGTNQGCEPLHSMLETSSYLQNQMVEQQDVTTSFKPKDVLGLLPTSAPDNPHDSGAEKDHELFDNALHYLKLNQAMRITEGLTSRSTLSVQLPTCAKDLQKAFYKAANEEQFTKSTAPEPALQDGLISYIYQGHTHYDKEEPKLAAPPKAAIPKHEHDYNVNAMHHDHDLAPPSSKDQGSPKSPSGSLAVSQSLLLERIKGHNLCASPLSERLNNKLPDPNYQQSLNFFDDVKNNSAEFIDPSLHALTLSQEDQSLKENLLNLEHSIHVLMNIIGCGVYIQSIGPNHERRLLWANKGLFELMGYEPDYIMSLSGEDFAQNFLHPDDVDKFFNTFKAENDSGQSVSLVYRVKQGKTGQYMWCSVKSAYLGRNGDHSLYMCMLNDITRERRLKDRMARWIRKNELLSEACQELIFEYDQSADHIERFGNYQQYVPSCQSSQDNYLDYINSQDFVHPDDRELFISIFTDNSIADGKSRRTIKFRLCPNGTNEYLWHVASIIGYTEETTGHIMIIGKINSIHHYESQIAKLNYETQLDPMTKLLNKTAMEHKVQQALLENPQSTSALLMVDIDNFKKVNDSHGHAFGDEVILMISRCLKNAFRSSDYVGRMGGDEFMVMLKDVNTEQAISLANIYHQVIKEECTKLSRPYPVTSSVGIAIFPESGTTYEEIYQKADMALYEVKQKHKGQVACFKDNKATLVSHMPNVLHNTEQRIANLARKVEQQISDMHEQERLIHERMERELLQS